VVTLAGGRRPRHRFLGQDNFAQNAEALHHFELT
jgi:hypothetical protein